MLRYSQDITSIQLPHNSYNLATAYILPAATESMLKNSSNATLYTTSILLTYRFHTSQTETISTDTT